MFDEPKIDATKLLGAALAPYGYAPEAVAHALNAIAKAAEYEALPNATRSGLALLEAERLTGDAIFCLRLGRSLNLSDFGSLGFAVMSCVNLREALELLTRYHPLLELGPEWRLIRGDQSTTLMTSAPGLEPEMWRALTEAAFSLLAKAGEDLIGRPITELSINVSYPEPECAHEYRAYLNTQCLFDQPNCEIVLPNWLLDQPIRTANPAGNVVFRQQCEEMLRSLNQVENVSARVRRVIMQAGRTDQDIVQVARALAFSERTLRRRLAEEGTSYRTIEDEVRNILARNYLATTQLTVADIAELLNYTEPASFRRAFKRLNGMTPQQFRKR